MHPQWIRGSGSVTVLTIPVYYIYSTIALSMDFIEFHACLDAYYENFFLYSYKI